MKNYEKPIVLANSELSEGVYAGSGGTVASSGDVVAELTSFDHYGNFYFKISGFDNTSTYRIVVKATETNTVNGLSNASWGDFGGVLSGNTVTFENVCFGNQTDWHIRLWFDSQGNWENGWRLSDNDIPSISVSVTKIS